VRSRELPRGVTDVKEKTAGSGSPGPRGKTPEPPFASGRSARPQADGDPDFAGDRSAPAEDVAQTDAPENDGWSGAEDNVEKRAPGQPGATRRDPHHRGDRRT
jgi:hypothetical protein